MNRLINLPGVPLPEHGFSEILHEVGLHEEILSRYPHEISGGQAQRLALARILLTKPELIILDEPTSGLDISVQAQILRLLKEVKKREKMSYIIISHDPDVLSFMSDRIYSMENGALS
jgi:ABC-type oligopeptide transport system, ATPase component